MERQKVSAEKGPSRAKRGTRAPAIYQMHQISLHLVRTAWSGGLARGTPRHALVMMSVRMAEGVRSVAAAPARLAGAKATSDDVDDEQSPLNAYPTPA